MSALHESTAPPEFSSLYRCPNVSIRRGVEGTPVIRRSQLSGSDFLPFSPLSSSLIDSVHLEHDQESPSLLYPLVCLPLAVIRSRFSLAGIAH